MLEEQRQRPPEPVASVREGGEKALGVVVEGAVEDGLSMGRGRRLAIEDAQEIGDIAADQPFGDEAVLVDVGRACRTPPR